MTSFAECYPPTRMLVTSRPYAYEPGQPWRLDDADFAAVSLADFDRAQIGRYVGGWYDHLAARCQIDADQAAGRSRDLCVQIEATSYLQPLAERPLLLAMMADLHASSGGRLRGGRAGLYEASVELLLDRWNETRFGQALTEDLGMPVERIRLALEELAFRVHRERADPDGERCR